MNRIWKFELKVVDDQIIEMPINSEILTVQIQQEYVQLWAIVNPELSVEQRHIRIYGTGFPVGNTKLKYISTFQQYNGRLVFHVFEVIE